MKKSFTIIVLALLASLASAQKSVTFTVDKNLPAPKKTFTMLDAEHVATQIVSAIGVPKEEQKVVKTSFEGQQLAHMGKDNFYKCILQAYADHRPLVLSPDMVWLIISQGFSRYVNANAEEMRYLMVSHEDKMELVVNCDNTLLPDADWEELLNDFSTSIATNTKGELADLITANFTTTGITERIASQISLMDVVKQYFIYTNISASCGIPSITLTGTPEDWQKVLEKARCLRKYNLEKWSDDLVAILKEFVEASKGKPNKKFWQSIVMKIRTDEIKHFRGCLPDPTSTTKVDGWILKFFPNAQGNTYDNVLWDYEMPQEMVRVSYRQVLTDPATGEPVDTIPMQLWAGFVGVEEDAKTRALTPKIGWLARIGDEDSDEAGRMKEQNRHGGSLNIELGNGQKVPVALSKLEHIHSLYLNFWNSPVIIPEWLDNIPIDNFQILGNLTDAEEVQLLKRFPKVRIKQVESLSRQFTKEQPQKTDSVQVVKAGDTISGTVVDAAGYPLGQKGPLFGATVCEIAFDGRIVESTVTDSLGMFSIKIKNPQDRLRFSYVGKRTVESTISFLFPMFHQKPHNRIVLEDATAIDMPEFENMELALEGHEVPDGKNPRLQVSLTDEEQALVMPVNDLGFNLFRKVSDNESILLSPMGMTFALGLIGNGAGGKTKTQINKVLGCDDAKAANINLFCRKMLTEAPKLDKLAKLQITDEFFSPKYAEIKPAFTKVANDSYDTQFKTADSDPFTFTLVNTIDFKGVWTDRFYKRDTQDELFMRENGKTHKVPMMKRNRNFFYAEDDLCQALCLPYSNGAYQMIVLLPKVGRTVKEVAESLTSDSWEKMYDAMRTKDVDLKLPRFESSSEVNLTGVMKALMPNAFDVKKADFSKIFNFSSYLANIKQLGRIKVDETGTEAFVATIMQGSLGGLNLVRPQTVRFYATRPFLYFIREWSTGTIFFIGQYMGEEK